MRTPIACPVCWNHVISRVEKVKLLAVEGDDSHIITAVSVYRCEDWHVFAVFDKSHALEERATRFNGTP